MAIIVEKRDYGPLPPADGPCYCFVPPDGNGGNCYFPSCGGRAPIESKPDWAKVYAKMDRK